MPTAPRASLGANSSQVAGSWPILVVGPGAPLASDARLHTHFARRPGFLLRTFALSVPRIAACCAFALVVGASANVAFAAPEDAPAAAVVPEDAPAAAVTRGNVPAPAVAPGNALADFAQTYVGSPYHWGGASPDGFDCTGFVMWVYSQFGVPLPHNEAGQLASGESVNPDELQPGDVVVFANTYRRGLSHVGIYVGDGQFVHAADERHGVVVSALWDSYWGPRLVGAARALA